MLENGGSGLIGAFEATPCSSASLSFPGAEGGEHLAYPHRVPGAPGRAGGVDPRALGGDVLHRATEGCVRGTGVSLPAVGKQDLGVKSAAVLAMVVSPTPI